MNSKIRKMILSEARRLKIPLPILKDGKEGGYAEGVLFIPEGMSFEDTLFIAYHELWHHFQVCYIASHNDLYSERISYEMNHYKEISYSDLYMEREAFYYALLKTEMYLGHLYSLPPEISWMVEEFKMENKKSFLGDLWK